MGNMYMISFGGCGRVGCVGSYGVCGMSLSFIEGLGPNY